MKPLLAFLCVIAVDLLRLTYLHRTQPQMPVKDVLTSVQIDVLSAKSPQLPAVLTVGWAIDATSYSASVGERLQLTVIIGIDADSAFQTSANRPNPIDS